MATCALVLFGLAAAFLCGYGPATLLLPAQHRGLRWMAMPTTGYLTFCLLVMVISGNSGMSVSASVPMAFVLLAGLALIVFIRQRRAPVPRTPDSHPGRVVALLATTLVVITGPAFLQSAELYLGSANLDFYQSLVFQDILRRNDLSVFAPYPMPSATHSIELSAKAWPPMQARFGGVMFSYLLESVAHVSPKAALTAAIIVFAACVPLSFYFFSRVVLGAGVRASTVAGLVAGVSSPLSLSFLYVLVGQGSGLSVLPLLIAVIFLAMREPSLRLAAYTGLLVSGLFWLYALMLPFALAPMGLLALYLLATRRLALRWGFAIAGVVIALLALAWLGMLGDLRAIIDGIVGISGRLAGTFFFIEFLTEMFFGYFLGITTYPVLNNILAATAFRYIGELGAFRVALVATFAVLVFYAASLRAWYRGEADDARRKAMLAMGAVYAAVWAYFTFVKPYGYGAFKMTAWLQFMVVPVCAYGLVHFWDTRAAGPRKARLALFGGLLYVAGNLVASLDYAAMSFGTNRDRGYVVNSFGLGDNPDLVTLGGDVSRLSGPAQSVGLTFTDAIQNQWAAYQLMRRTQQSILSHANLPEDDVALPDPVTGELRDTSGEVKKAPMLTLQDVRNDFYLLPGAGNLNPEITLQQLPPPVWQDRTFQLQPRERLRDFLFVGRGFYRNEFPRSGMPWWQGGPTMRWSREGAEFYILQATRPGEPYRIELTARVGFGIPTVSRTLEFYHGAQKFDEQTVTDVARVVSAPFHPKGGLDRVTVLIRERTPPIPRRMGLWNMSLPDDSRSLNMQVSRVRLLKPGERAPAAIAPGRMAGNDILDKAALFNGIGADGWIGKGATFTYVSPVDRPVAILDLLVPGNLGFAFPYAVDVVANGTGHRFSIDKPGRTSLRIPFDGAKKGDPLAFEVRPQAFRESDDPFARRNRPIFQSVHLEAIEIAAQP